jgi:hypothetical protein
MKLRSNNQHAAILNFFDWQMFIANQKEAGNKTIVSPK